MPGEFIHRGEARHERRLTRFERVTESPEDVERLRARLRELEEQLAARDAAPVADVRSRRDRQWWRSIIVVVLIVVAAVLAPLTVVATWAHDQIGDTDRFERDGCTARLGSGRAGRDRGPDHRGDHHAHRRRGDHRGGVDRPGRAGLRSLTSRRGAALPGGSAEQCHRELRACARRPGRDLARPSSRHGSRPRGRRTSRWSRSSPGTPARPSTSPTGRSRSTSRRFVESVKQILIDDGFSFAERIPEVNASFTIFQAENIGAGAEGVRAGWTPSSGCCPVLALLLLFIAVMVARDRRKALLTAGLAIAGLHGAARSRAQHRAAHLPGRDPCPTYSRAMLPRPSTTRWSRSSAPPCARSASSSWPSRWQRSGSPRPVPAQRCAPVRRPGWPASQPDRHGHRAGRPVPGDLPHLHPGHRRDHRDAGLSRDRPSHRRQRRR